MQVARVDRIGAGPTRLRTLAALAAGLALPLIEIGRAVMAVALVAALGAILLMPDRKRRFRDLILAVRSPVGLAVILLFLVWLPSVLQSIDPAKSIFVWSRMLVYLAGGVVLWSFLKDDEAALAVVARAMILGVLATLAIAAFNFAGLPEVLNLLRLRGWNFYTPINMMKSYSTTGASLVPVLLWLGWRTGGRWWRLALLAASGLVVVALLNRSGAAMVGLLAGGGLALVACVSARRGVAPFAAVFAAVAVAGAAGLLWFSGQSIADYGDPATFPLPPHVVDDHRQAIWLFTLSKVPSAPWFGHGIDAINKIEGAGQVIPAFGQELIPSHPHNWVIEVLAETGFVGLTALVATLALLLLVRIRAAFACGERAGAAAAAGLFGAFVGSALFSFSFWASWWQLTFIVLWAIVAASIGPRPAARTGGA